MNGLTPDEHRAMELTAELTDLFCTRIVQDGPTRTQDVREFISDIHAIQHTIMGQAAARVHPELYRLLGGVIEP